MLERQALGGAGAIGFGNANIDQAHASPILAGLSLNPALRPQNALVLMNALGLNTAALHAYPAAGMAQAMPYPAQRQYKSRPVHKEGRTGARVLIAAISVFLALCAGAAAFYFYTDSKYNEAIALHFKPGLYRRCREPERCF